MASIKTALEKALQTIGINSNLTHEYARPIRDAIHVDFHLHFRFWWLCVKSWTQINSFKSVQLNCLYKMSGCSFVYPFSTKSCTFAHCKKVLHTSVLLHESDSKCRGIQKLPSVDTSKRQQIAQPVHYVYIYVKRQIKPRSISNFL